jgi:Recombinase
LSRIVLAFRSLSSGRYAILVALLGFSTSGFHRFCTTKPIRSETNKQYGCQLATMVPLGTRGPYRNNKVEHTIEADPEKAPLPRRMFDLYATGKYSLSQLRLAINSEFGVTMAKGYLDRLLKNPFYAGSFIWDGKSYTGTQTPLVDRSLFEQVQAVFQGRNKPRYQKHDFAFRGLLSCAYDDCMVTAEIKKQKYAYYRCTGSRGKCELPYFREEELGNRLGQILKDIYIPDHVLSRLVESLLLDKGCETTLKQDQEQRLQQRLSSVLNRLDQAYLDKLDGKISGELWIRKSAEWQAEEQHIQMAIREIAEIKPERMLDAVKILELGNKAYFLYVKQSPPEKAKLLNLVLSNCAIDAASVYPTYRKPFEVIFAKGKNEGWRARRDSNSRPSGSKESGVNSKSRQCRRFRAAALLYAFQLCSKKSCSLSVLVEAQFRYLSTAESMDSAGFHEPTNRNPTAPR